MKDLQEALKLRWRLTSNRKDEDANDSDEDEVGLSNDTIICDRCGGKGHTAANCWKQMTKQDFQTKGKGKQNHKKINGKRISKRDRKRFTGTCNYCDQVGHKERNCFKKPENASKRPSGWVSKMNNSKGGNSGIDICLPCVDDEECVESERLHSICGTHVGCCPCDATRIPPCWRKEYHVTMLDENIESDDEDDEALKIVDLSPEPEQLEVEDEVEITLASKEEEEFKDTKSEVLDGDVMGRCQGCNSLGPIGLICYECEDQGFVFESLHSRNEKNDQDESEDSEDDKDRYVKEIIEEYTTVELMISERATHGVVYDRSKVKTDYIKRNKKYHGKLILFKHQSQLIGKLMGVPT